MKVVLIHPYMTVRSLGIYLTEPLGLLCLASYLKQVFGREVDVSILDLYAMGARRPRRKGDWYMLGVDDEALIQEKLRGLSPDLIGVHCNFTAYAADALEIASTAKSAMPGVPVVLGGAHATMAAETILRDNSCVDFVVRHEGEETLACLVRKLRGELAVDTILGLSYRAADGTVMSNPPRELIEDLDVLPIPDRRFIDMAAYRFFNRENLWYIRKEPVASIITSRGCPYDCVFCSTKVMWKRRWRARSLANVFDEIEMLVSQYRIREIAIFDDQFFLKKDRVHEFCDYFIRRGLDLCFSYDSGTSPWLVDQDLLAKMRRAGFYALRFPIETGNQATLKFIRKPIDLDQSRSLVAQANRLGYWTSGNFIIGFPYETREEMMETVRYAYESGLDFASFIAARPHQGSELFEIFQKEGMLDRGLVRTSEYDHCDYDTTTMTAVEINRILTRASSGWYFNKLLFYASPKGFSAHLLPKFKTLGDFAYATKIAYMLLRKKIVPLLRAIIRSALRRR